jgi:hypothetical protein
MPMGRPDSPDHGCACTQRIVASPSARSSNGANVPPEPNVPRTLWSMTWKPRSASSRP